MEPLDLRKRAPRSPRAELAGLIFLPRSIDKARATLPGGDLGAYNIDGFTKMMLDDVGISVEAFTKAVHEAANDEDIAGFVRAHLKPGGVDTWNTFARARLIAGGDRALAERRYPWLAERPEMILALDALEEDDRRSFSEA